MTSEELQIYEDELYKEDDDIENEEEKELEEYLYSKVHYASKVDIVDGINEQQDSEESQTEREISFPETQCTTSWEGILGVNNEKEKKSKNLGAVIGEDADEWDIDDVDLDDGGRKRTAERYYLPEQLPNIYCFNCGQKGHIGRDCSEDRKLQTCYLCGIEGHQRRGCPSELCFNCMGTGHFARDCQVKRKNRQYLRCNRCRRKGHDGEECSEIWRQYHCTITPGELTKPSTKERNKKNPKRCCYNCASRNHFGENCPEYRYSLRTIYSQFVVNYDECPSNQKSLEKKDKDAEEKKLQKEEEQKERRREKRKQKKALLAEKKEAERQKKKEQEESDQKKKLEEKKKKNEKKEKKLKALKEAEEQEEKEKEEKRAKKEEKRAKKEMEKSKKEEENKRKRKHEEIDSPSLPHEDTKRTRKSIDMIKNNLWVSDDDLHVYKNTNSFSMKDHLNISSDEEENMRRKEKRKKSNVETVHLTSDSDQDEDTNNKSTKESKRNSKERKDEKKVSRNDLRETREDNRRSRNDSGESRDESKRSENERRRSGSGTREERDERTISKNNSRERNYDQIDLRETINANKTSKSESKEILDENKVSEMDSLETTRNILIENECDERNLHSEKHIQPPEEKDSPRKLAARLDYESLQNLKDILYSDDDENENDDTLTDPIPDPKVHFEASSDASTDDDDDDGDDTYNIDDEFINDEVNYVSFEDSNMDDTVEEDLTRYDPAAIYQEDLVKYGLINATEIPMANVSSSTRGFKSRIDAYKWHRSSAQSQAPRPFMPKNTPPRMGGLSSRPSGESSIFKYDASTLKGLLTVRERKLIRSKKMKFSENKLKNLGFNLPISKKECQKLLRPYNDEIQNFTDRITEETLKKKNISRDDAIANRAKNKAASAEKKKKKEPESHHTSQI